MKRAAGRDANEQIAELISTVLARAPNTDEIAAGFNS